MRKDNCPSVGPHERSHPWSFIPLLAEIAHLSKDRCFVSLFLGELSRYPAGKVLPEKR